MNKQEKPRFGKTSAIIFAVCDDELLMQEMEHQGGKIFDVFGSFIAEGEDAQVIIDAKVAEKIDGRFAAVPFGEILDHIEKPESHTDLTALVFRINISPIQRAEYTLKEKQFWANESFIKNNTGIRHGDQLIFIRALENRPIDIELSESQLEKWIDAKLLSWEDRV